MPQTVSAYDADCPKDLKFGKALKKFRERRDWVVRRLEELTNKSCTRGNIQRWENGEALPTNLYFVEQLILALRCNEIESGCLLEHYLCESLQKVGKECDDEMRINFRKH